MKQAFILHGVCDEEEYLREDFPSPSNAHWLPWLQQRFLRKGYLAQCLEMPTPYQPDYAAWCEVWERQTLGSDDVLVGHSAGAGFLLKWLSFHPEIRVAKLVLVAPWLDPMGEHGSFLETELDAALLMRVGAMDVVFSEDDPVQGVKETVARVREVYPAARVHRFKGLGHFCWDDTGPEFLALAEICRL